MKKNIFLCIAVLAIGAISTSWIAPTEIIKDPPSKYRDLENNFVATVSLLRTYFFNFSDPSLGNFDKRSSDYNSAIRKLLASYKVARIQQYKKATIEFSGYFKDKYRIDHEIFDVKVSPKMQGIAKVYIDGIEQTSTLGEGDFYWVNQKQNKEIIKWKADGSYSANYITMTVDDEMRKLVNRLVEDGLLHDLSLIYTIE